MTSKASRLAAFMATANTQALATAPTTEQIANTFLSKSDPTITGTLAANIVAVAGNLTITGTTTTSNTIVWNANGVGAPTANIRSAGTKIVLSPNVAIDKVDYAIGIETDNMWSSVSSSAQGFKWYANTFTVMTANVYGVTLPNTLRVGNSSVYSQFTQVSTYLQVNATSVGMSIAGNGNVGIGTSVPGSKLVVNGAMTAVDVTVSGNLTVSGTTTYINTTNLNVGDNIVSLNADLGASAPSENAGISVNRGTSANVAILWDESIDKWTLTNDGTTYANIATGAAGATLVANTTDTSTYYLPLSNATTGSWTNGVVDTAMTYIPSTHTLTVSRISHGNSTVNTSVNSTSIAINGSVGTTGQVLTSNGSATYWSTVSGGGGLPASISLQNTTGAASGLGLNAIAIGVSSGTGDDYTIAIGVSANAYLANSIAVGRGARTNGYSTISLGANTFANGNYAIAIGLGARSIQGIALGYNASANSPTSIAVGGTAIANGVRSIAVGQFSNAYSANSIALGINATSSSDSSMAIGYRAYAYGYRSIALGHDAIAGGTDSVAIGYNAQAGSDNQIVLGSVNHTTVIPGALQPSGTIIVGGTYGVTGQVLYSGGSGSPYWGDASGGGGGFSNGSSIQVANLQITGSLTANGNVGNAGMVLYSAGPSGIYWAAAPSGGSGGGGGSSSPGDNFIAKFGPTAISYSSGVASFTVATAGAILVDVGPPSYDSAVQSVGGPGLPQFTQFSSSYVQGYGQYGSYYPWYSMGSVSSGATVNVSLTSPYTGTGSLTAYVLDSTTNPSTMQSARGGGGGTSYGGEIVIQDRPSQNMGLNWSTPNFFYGFLYSQGGPGDYSTFVAEPGVTAFWNPDLFILYVKVPGSMWRNGTPIGTVSGFSGSYGYNGYFFGDY